jgi:ABC-type polysaccharide/polyol phosphate transport system ATPase subunit
MVAARAPIVMREVGKRYVKYEDAPMLVTRALRFRSRTRRSQFWAIRHLNLEVEEGASIGIIGRNGSGKTTVLRLLAGVTAPTEGVVSVRGRVAPLISVGVGFHQELTGRENVYINGTVLGLSRRQLDERFDEIVAFAEVAPFIDTPVKFYSSGMLVRLGFAVALGAEPELLLVDEVLSVGDLAFQVKSFDRMLRAKESGTTIVVVSHNLNAIRNLCSRCLVFHDGVVRYDGDTDGAISLYHELLGEPRELGDEFPLRSDGSASGDAEVLRVSLLGPDGLPTAHFKSGEEVVFRAEVRFHRMVEHPVCGIAIHSESGVPVYWDGTPMGGPGQFRAGTAACVDARVPLNLATGSYRAVMVLRAWEGDLLGPVPPPLLFYVSGRHLVGGIADLGAQFTVTEPSATGHDGDGLGELPA